MRRMIPTKTIDVLSNIAYDSEKKAVEIGTNLEVDGLIKENGTLQKTSIAYNTTSDDTLDLTQHEDGIYEISSTAKEGTLDIIIPLNYIIISEPFSINELISGNWIDGYVLGTSSEQNSITFQKTSFINKLLIIKKGSIVYIQLNGEV